MAEFNLAKLETCTRIARSAEDKEDKSRSADGFWACCAVSCAQQNSGRVRRRGDLQHSKTRSESGHMFLSRSKSVPDAAARRFSRPDGYLVYWAEATGRERSQADLLTTGATSRTANPPAFLPQMVNGANTGARIFPAPDGCLVHLAEAAGRERSQPDLLTTGATSRTANPPGVSATNGKWCKHRGAHVSRTRWVPGVFGRGRRPRA